MRKSRSFTASGFDLLEGRVVMSHAHAMAAVGALGGHKAKVVDADFATFRTNFNSAIAPLVKDLQNATTAEQVAQDLKQIDTATTDLVNGLGRQLSSQLGRRLNARIRSVITGAPSPTGVDFAASLPAPGSLLGTLRALPQTTLANKDVVNNLSTAFESAMISGGRARRVGADFASFQSSFNKTIAPLVKDVENATTDDQKAQAEQKLQTAVTDLVNNLGAQLSRDLKPKAGTA